MYGFLLISLRVCGFLKLLSFQSIGAGTILSTSENRMCIHLSPFFCSMTSEGLNIYEYPYSNKANPCWYFTKSHHSVNCSLIFSGKSLCIALQSILMHFMTLYGTENIQIMTSLDRHCLLILHSWTREKGCSHVDVVDLFLLLKETTVIIKKN